MAVKNDKNVSLSSDGTPPVIENCPDDITITTGQPEWTMPTAKDNGQLVSFYSDRTSGDIFPVGRTMVTYTAVDDVGLTSECSFIVTLIGKECNLFSHLVVCVICSFRWRSFSLKYFI